MNTINSLADLGLQFSAMQTVGIVQLFGLMVFGWDDAQDTHAMPVRKEMFATIYKMSI